MTTLNDDSLQIPLHTDIIDLARMVHMLPVTYDQTHHSSQHLHTAISGDHLFEMMHFDISQAHPQINKLRKQLQKAKSLECSFPPRRSKNASNRSKYLIRFKPPFQVTTPMEIVHTIYSRARDKWMPDPKPGSEAVKSTSGLTVAEREELLLEQQRKHLARIRAGGEIEERPTHLPRRDGVRASELNFLYYKSHSDVQEIMNAGIDILSVAVPTGSQKGVLQHNYLLFPNFPKFHIPRYPIDESNMASAINGNMTFNSSSFSSNQQSTSIDSRPITSSSLRSQPLRKDIITLFHDISVPGHIPGGMSFDDRALEQIMHASHLPVLKYAKSKAQMEAELYSDETVEQRRKRLRRDDRERRILRKKKRVMGY